MYRKVTASQIFNGFEFLPSKQVVIADHLGNIRDVVSEHDAGDDIQYFDGILCPGFINTHCHLELSHLKGMIPQKTGLIDFVSSVMEKRHFQIEMIQDSLSKAEASMLENGIVAIGDICNTNVTIDQKKKNNIFYHNFLEVTGFPKEVANPRFEKIEDLYREFTLHGLSSSIVPHAPYSVSIELFKKINAFANNDIVSIHNQETTAENEWYQNKSGSFLDFYNKYHITTDSFEPFNSSSLQAILPFFTQQKSLMFVHNVFTTEEDVAKAIMHVKKCNSALYFCLCPKANMYIGGELPDIDMLIKNKANITLGTDSLASNDELSILSEIKLIQNKFPHIPLALLLKWATYNGAQALQIESQYGSFEKGKQPGMLLIQDSKVLKLH